jgi:GDP-4-dehydro-6-deoxy-D-mannose reductase
MKARALIVGATGFSGRHMVECCLGEGLRVYGAARHAPRESMPHSRFDFVRCDAADARQTQRLIQRVRPTHVMSLVSGHELTAAKHVVAAASRGTKVLLVGSCAAYGVMASGQRISEEDRLRPVSPYGRAKRALESWGLRAHQQQGTPVYVARTFNLVGPGQPRGFVAADVVAQYREWQAGAGKAGPVIRLADPDMVRDFLDVRDAVRAYWAILQQGRPGTPYNVCSGRGVAVRDLPRVLDRCVRVHARVERHARPAPSRSRLVRRMIGSNRRLKRDTSWCPRVPLETSLRDMLTLEPSCHTF